MSRERRRIAARTAGALALLLLAGCVTYQDRNQEFAAATQAGGLATAVTVIDRQVDANTGKKDELVYRLEQGGTLFAAALADPAAVPAIEPADAAPEEVHRFYFNRSIAAFDAAEVKVNAWEQQAAIRLGAETGALLTNQASLPYRGRAYDKVMMNTYKAVGYLALGERDRARVELNRSLQRQRDAVEANKKRLAAVQAETAQAQQGELRDASGRAVAYDANRALEDPRTGPELQAVLDASLAPLQPYGDYVNPFAVFLDGLFFTVLGEGGSDLERGRKSFERVAAMVPDNAFVRDDLAAATLAAGGRPPEGVTYVIFETGTAPVRSQVRVDIPTFLVTSKLAYVGAAFPKLQYNPDYIPSLGVTAGGQSVATSLVASMDSVIANDFKNEWPSMVARTLLTTASKALLQSAVQQEAQRHRDSAWAAIAEIAMLTTNMATTIADTRTWTSLPKEFQYARVATPADRRITLEAHGVQKTIVLEPAAISIVYVKSASSAAPLLVSTFVLK